MPAAPTRNGVTGHILADLVAGPALRAPDEEEALRVGRHVFSPSDCGPTDAARPGLQARGRRGQRSVGPPTYILRILGTPSNTFVRGRATVRLSAACRVADGAADSRPLPERPGLWPVCHGRSRPITYRASELPDRAQARAVTYRTVRFMLLLGADLLDPVPN